MIDPACLASLRSAPGYSVWRGAVHLAPLEPAELLSRATRQSLGLRVLRPGHFDEDSVPQLLAAWKDGLSIQIKKVHLIWPEVQIIVNQVSAATGLVADGAGTIWSRAGKRACGPHTDGVHVLALHLRGQKMWSRTELQGGPTAITLGPGDMMLVRAGEWHVCDPVTDCQHVAVRLRRE